MKSCNKSHRIYKVVRKDLLASFVSLSSYFAHCVFKEPASAGSLGEMDSCRHSRSLPVSGCSLLTGLLLLFPFSERAGLASERVALPRRLTVLQSEWTQTSREHAGVWWFSPLFVLEPRATGCSEWPWLANVPLLWDLKLEEMKGYDKWSFGPPVGRKKRFYSEIICLDKAIKNGLWFTW